MFRRQKVVDSGLTGQLADTQRTGSCDLFQWQAATVIIPGKKGLDMTVTLQIRQDCRHQVCVYQAATEGSLPEHQAGHTP